MKDQLMKRMMDRGVSLVLRRMTPVTEQMRSSLRSALLRARAMGLGTPGRGPLPSIYADRVWNPAGAAGPILD